MGSYSSAEMQSPYTTAPVDRAWVFCIFIDDEFSDKILALSFSLGIFSIILEFSAKILVMPF